MDVSNIYRKYLFKYRWNKHRALKAAMHEITKHISSLDINDNFMKEYYKAKRHLMILNVISPSILLGLSTGLLVSVLNVREMPFNLEDLSLSTVFQIVLFLCGENILPLIIGVTGVFFLVVFNFGTRVKCVLYPHLVKQMEERIEESYRLHNIKNTNKTVFESKRNTMILSGEQ
ncbi:MAG: hypothetical protein IJ518_08225 [Clostridia bacterium]|nr:hypothetical protein [Clostridia bacterium]